MTSPVQAIRVECPRCGVTFDDWWRPSINLGLGEQFSEDYLLQASTATCPECGHVAELDALVIDGGDVWRFGPAAPGPRIIAVGGTGYLVSLDGSDTEESPSVMYDPVGGTIGHVAMAASHLKMLNGYSEPFDGSDNERERRAPHGTSAAGAAHGNRQCALPGANSEQSGGWGCVVQWCRDGCSPTRLRQFRHSSRLAWTRPDNRCSPRGCAIQRRNG